MEVPTITIGERLSSYLNGDDAQKSDVELAKEAQYLADQRWKMGQLMLQDGDKFKSDEYLRGEAMAIGQALVGKVGGEDAYGVMWSPDQRGYRTGREFKDAMVKLWKEPESFVSKDWEEFSKLDRAGKLAKAMEDVSATKRAMHAVGNVLEDMVAEGVGTGANAGSGSVWAGGAGDASRVKPVSDEAKAARQTAWEDRIIRDHEAKLRKKNAWMDLMAISANMKGDAKTCLDALLESPDNALPERLYGTFNALSDDDKEIVCHARELMKPTWDGSDAGTVVHDATVGLLNIAAKLKKAPFEQAKKLTAIAANEWFDAGIDVNAIAKRRQYLWDVTGGLSEKNSDMMEFEQRCEDHGVIGDALIGAVSTLPYMAVAAVPYAGPALVAAEAMQEMDEHVVREGGDITDPKYLVSSAVLGGLYAYIERLQVGKLLGEVGDLELRGAMVKGLWQAWRDKPALMAWNLTEKTLSESVQEGLQNGIMGVNEALALGKSVPAAFGEGFVEDFVGSLGTMFVVGAGGHVLGHAARSGWKAGAEGQSIRAGSYAEAVRDAARTAGVFELGEASAANRTVEIAASLDKLYGAWQRGGRKVLEGRGLSSDTIDQIEDYYRQAERLTDGMTPSADEKFKVATAIAGDISANIAEENRRLREDPERVGRAEGWLGCGNGLADMRRTWARGNALTQYKTDEDGKVVTDENGKPVIEADLGAKELEEDGYAPEVAKALSELLRQEHREFYSKGAVDAMRHAYETATDRQTAAAERLAASLKGGEVVRRDGLTFVRFDMEAGKDADGKPIVGKGEYLIEEHPEFADFKPDFANPKANEAASIERRFAGKMTAERWMSNEMTPAEREAFWNENASGMEGSFSLVNPATGSRISAEGVKLLGRIDIDPRADETAIYHENLHGLVRFCRETGVLNEEDAATFVAAFGERRPGADELFNEEAAADAARSFVVKRRNGSAIEDTPANRALAKLFSFGMRIAAEGDIRWAEQKAAEKAMKAVTDQMEVTAANRKAAETQKNEKPVSDNANGGSDNANGAEATSAITDEDFTKPTRDVSLPAMPAAVGDLIGANGRPVIIKKNIFEKNRDSHPELTPEESRRILGLALYNPTLVGQTQPQKRPHYWVSVKTGEDDNATVVVDVYPSKDNVEIVGWRKINDKGLEKLKRQAEREDGQLLMLSPETGSAAALSALPSGTSQGSISKPAEEVKPAAKPATWEAAVPKSPYRVKGHYLVLKLKDVVSSDDPAYAVHKDWQNRIGENKLAEASLQQIKDSFYWKAYGDSAFTDTGAPIVLFAEDAEGKLRPFVVSGNGRMMVLKSLLKDHMYDRYRGGLKEMAAEMGLEVPEDGEEYVLVRAIDDLGGVSIDEFVTKSNGDNKRKVGDAARAKQDAATIVANGLAALYRSNVDGTPDMTPGVNDEFFRLFSQRATDGDAIYDENFNVVEEGKNRVMRALLYVSCGQGDRGPETVDKVILMTDTLGIRRQRNAMECCAAAVAALEANPDYAIGADVSRAMADYMDFVEKKRAGKVGTFEDYLGEQDMFSRRSEIADGVLRLLGSGKNAREIADVVKAYCDIATKSDRDGGLQGAEAARTREDVWREAVAAVETNAVRHSFAALGPDALEVAGVGTPKIAVDLLASTRWSVGNSYADGKLSDLELIDIYRKGDPDALAELYRRYDAPTTEDGKTGGVVGLIARKYPTISDEEKEDLHQEVWVRIINDLDGDVDFSKFSWSTYIFNALRWAAANYYRDENKKPLATLDAPIGDEANGTIESLRTTADSVWVADGERSRKREVLRQLFEILPPDQAAVMNRIADGKTAKEIAKELGLHEYDVKNIKARVIAALKKKATAPADAPQTGVAVSAGMRHVVPIERTEAPVPHVPRVLTSSWRAVASDRLHSASDAAQYSGKEGEKSKENLKDPLRVSLGRLKLTPTEMQVVELTESGLSTKEIAERLGKSASTVLVHLSNARAKGWEAPVKEKNIFSTRELQVLDLRDKGLTSSEIAKETGLSVASVGVHLSNASKKGWEPSEEGQSIRAKKAGITIMGLSKREGEVWALHEKGMRGVDIAKQLGISSATVDVHLSNARKKMAFKAKNVERRLSVAPKGAQKGAAVAYPDASDELRAMSDAAESPRWSVGISPERQKDAEAAVESLKNTRTATSVTDAGTVLRENGAVNRPLTNKILGITARITGNSLSKMMSEKATKKSRSPYLHALAVANADRIFECAFCDATHPDTHGRKEVEKVHRLGSMLHDPKSGMFEPVLVTVIEYKRDGDNVYTLEVVDVDAYEKSDSAGQLVAFADGKRQTPIAEYVGIIAQRVRDFNRAEAIKRVDHKWVDGQQRWSVAASPTLREDVEAALLKRDAAHPDAIQRGRHDEIVFSDNIPVFEFLGLPNLRVVTEVSKIRKFAIKHHLSVDQIVDIPNGYDNPVAIMRDEDGYVLLTDRQVTTDDGEQKPMRLFLRPTKWRSGEIVLLATAMAENGRDELEYYEPRIKAGLMFADENRIAGLNLGEETESILRIQASGENVKTAADFSAWKSTQESIAKSAAGDKGPRLSIGARRRAEFRELMGRKRPDIAAEDVEAYLDEIAGYDNAKKQKLAVHWIITGAIELPEDAYKLDKAIATAERAKVDPFRYRNPEDIFAAFPQHLPKEKPIDPDTVPELTGKRDMGHGVTVYDVSEKIVKGKRRAGQVAMRKVINTHWGKDASPWCLLQGDGNGELTEESRGYWEHYSALPKKVAFLNGRLLAFMATDDTRGNEIHERDWQSFFEPFTREYGDSDFPGSPYDWMKAIHPEELEKYEANVKGKIPEQWWDRKDASHDGIPIEGKIAGDPLGRSGLQELKDGKLELVGRMWKGDRKNGKYEEWNLVGNKVLEEEFKNGRPFGWRRAYSDHVPGKLKSVEHFNEKGEHDRPQVTFNEDKGITYIEYTDGDRPLRSLRVGGNGDIVTYQMNGGEGSLAKIAIHTPSDGTNISWTDDAGNYYSTFQDRSGNIDFAYEIRKGEYGRRSVDLSDAALRAKLEGESAAVLEAVKAEAAAIYREYSPAAATRGESVQPRASDGAAQDGTRWSIARRLNEEREAVEAKGGELLLAHHGTDSRGFTRFEKSDDIGYFFAKSRRTAASYIRHGQRGDENKPGMPDYSDVMTFLEDEASGYTPEEVEAMSYEEKVRAYVEGTGEESGVYDVALKMEDPYRIDCHGANWDAIYDVSSDPEATTYDLVAVEYDGIEGQYRLRTREFGEEDESVKTFEDFDGLAQVFEELFGEELGTDLQEFEAEVDRGEKATVTNEIVDGRPEKGATGAVFSYRAMDGEGWWTEAKKTRDIVEDAANMGCDGVIFYNVVDNGGGIREADADDVYVVMKSEQVKSVDSMTYADDGSIIPAEKRFDWKNPDIRWSVGVLPSGENVVILDRTEEIAKINLNDPKSLHDYLVGKVGKELFDNFVVGSDAPDEYVYSKDAQGNNKRVRKAKAKLATSLDEAAAVASDASTEPAAHKEREGGVYYRRRFLFAAPSGFGGDYRAYSADMISYMEDGVEQFYDVVNIEDAPSVSADLTQLSARIAANGTSRIPADGGATPRSISNPAAADNPLAAIANAKTTREVEAAARMSFSARLADGDERAAENALVNYVAYHKLTGGAIPRATTLARLGLALGMKTVQANRIIEDAQRVADRAAGTVIEKAARNGDVGTAFSLMEREKERDEELRKIISGGAKAGGDLVLGGVVAQGTLLGRRIEQTMRGMTAATLADMEGDTGLDLAAEILQNDPKAFDEELKPLKPQRGEGPAPDDTSSGEETQPSSQPLTDREKWQRAEAAKEAAKRVQAFIEAAKQRAEENRRKAEERRAREAAARAAGEEPSEGGESGGDASETKPSTLNSQPSTPTVAGFKNKWEFAAFVRKWAEDKYAQTHGTTTLGKSEENRLFAEFYRICVQKQLQDLADKLLDPKGARAWANRRIGELEKGLKPDTIERASADIFAFINRNAIREERVKLIEKFRKDIRQFIQGAEFEELKADSTRRLTGWVEEAARYMMKVCQLSGWAANGGTSQFERERQELLDVINARRKIYDESGKPVEDAEKSDAETVWARWKLNLLEQFGAMAQMMPGEIEDLRQDAIRYLTEEAAALEERWKDAKAWQDGKRRALAGAIVGPNGQKYDSKAGYFGQLFDALNGMLRLRLKHLMRFAGKKERAEGEAAADEIVTMLGQGETAYARAVQRDRAELWKALGRIFQTPDGRLNRKAAVAYMKRMEEEIPQELSRQLSFQGYAERMTYGQMLQLLVSLEQRSYAANVKANGREGQAELIRSSAAFTTADALFVDWLRAFYEAKRGEISAVTERMVGNKVESPDPLYCPVKIYRGEMAKDLHIDAGRWNAIDDVLSRRVMHTRDFDESATVLGQFYDRSNRMAGLVAWAERGTLIENVICSGAVQQQIGLAFGQHESSVIRRQLEDTFNGGQSRSKTPGEIVMMDKAMNFVTFGYLGFNPLSAVKQTTSFTVWANVLPGGFRELWHHMTHVDREAIRHIMESEEYKVRYGDDTGSGQDFATKALNENAGLNPLMRLMTGPGMWLLKKGDFLPGVWIMQGVYKSLLNKHLNEGMEETAADRLAITEAFNLLEETQQSGRTYNTNALAREHGRLGAALVQFATSPLQQLQYETQAFREWRDLKRYGADPERIAEARAKLIRAAFINHVLLPAALELVVTVFRAIMGDEPRWEKDGYAWDLLRDVLLGQASRIFYVGVLASSVMDALFKRQLPRGSQLIPSEGAITIMANVAVTAHDVMSMDGEKVRKDLERMVKSLAPTRIPYNLYRRVTGDSDVDRKRAKGK